MVFEGLPGPAGEVRVRVVVVVVEDEVEGELAAHDKLLEKGVRVLAAAGVPRLQGQPDRGDVPVVQVLAHVGDVIGLGLVAVPDVVVEAPLKEAAEDPLRLGVSAPVQVAQAARAPVEVHPVQDPVDVREVEAFFFHVGGRLVRLCRGELDEKVV